MTLFFGFHFYLFGVLAVVSALTFVTRRSPVAAALWLVTTMFSLSAMFVMMDAQFIGVIQVLVYAGAIMVVFLFVVMLLNLGQPTANVDMKGPGTRLAATVVGLLMIGDLVFVVLGRQTLPDVTPEPIAAAQVVSSVAAPLFAADGFLLPFEVTSVLLLAAIIGAVVLAKRRS
ncbi:MAG: NADH-quinone oxidoreductase subunit J family protein [Gemmatimonadaceae bacterium]